MYRRRRFYRRPRVKRPSDRIIRAANTGTVTSATQVQAYIYEADKPQTVMNIKLDTGIVSTQPSSDFAYCLVYVPEGYDVTNINYPASSDDLYNPTKNVIISGILTNIDGSEDHKYSRIGRRMATGDRIALIYRNIGSQTGVASFELNFTALF